MGIAEIRYNNLITLIDEHDSIATLAKKAGTAASYISEIKNKTKTPKGKTRGVGDVLAYKLEIATGKPKGWMDITHNAVNEVAGEYDIPTLLSNPNTPEQAKRICEYITWWMCNNNLEERHWFEGDFKRHHPEYSNWLRSKDSSPQKEKDGK